MALEGNLRDFGILEVIQLLGQQGKSGVLRIWDTTGEQRQIFLCEGKVSHATTSRKEGRDLLGERLAKTGIVSRHDFERALDIQRESGRYLGEILVERQMTDETAVLNALYTQIHEIIYEIFKIGEGKFKFEMLPMNQFPSISVNLSAEEVMLNILRMVDEWPEISRRLPPPDMIVQRTGTLEEHDITLPEDHDVVYRLVDGKRTVNQISDLSVLGKFATLEVLGDLLESGYITTLTAKKADGEVHARPSTVPTLQPVRRTSRGIGILILVLMLAAASSVGFRPRVLVNDLQRTISVPEPYIERMRHERILRGHILFVLEENRTPRNLNEMVSVGILTKEDVR